MSDRIDKAILKLAADSLKEYTVLTQGASCRAGRRAKEAHPKAVLSTKTPSTSAQSQIVASPRCLVSRQASTPVDLPSPTPGPEESFGVTDTPPPARPSTLGVRRHFSTNSSGSSGVTTPCQDPPMCSPLPCSPDERLLGSSYPPGPQMPQCFEVPSNDWGAPRHGPCLSLPGFAANPQGAARKIAERLKTIGDEVTKDNNMSLNEFLENCVPSQMSWGDIVCLYNGLSHLLTQSLSSSSTDLENNESWLTFNKLWKKALQTVASWIGNHGYAFIRETDDSSSHFLSSTPDCSRRRFTYPNTPVDPPRYSTPQVPRRSLGQNQSSPAICSARGERGSRVLSLTQEGLFQEDGYEEDPMGDSREHSTGGPDALGSTDAEEGDVQTSPDEGVQFLMPGAGGNFLSEDGTAGSDAPPPLTTPLHGSSALTSPLSRSPNIASPGAASFWSVGTPPQCFATPIQPRPQSSTLLREGMTATCNRPFDRTRSMSYPRHTHRPNSAEAASQQRLTCRSVVLENKEMMSESLDSGLAASSETSIASSDSAMQYSALGVSAFCIYQAVKAMLDHK